MKKLPIVLRCFLGATLACGTDAGTSSAPYVASSAPTGAPAAQDDDVPLGPSEPAAARPVTTPNTEGQVEVAGIDEVGETPSAADSAGAATGEADPGSSGSSTEVGEADGSSAAAPGEQDTAPSIDVPACPSNLIANCSGSPLACHFGGDPGNYTVTVELGGEQAGDTRVEAETARRMLTRATLAGENQRFSFVTNVRVYEGEPVRPDQDGTTSKGTPGLDVYFRGPSPRPVSICYEPTERPLMLWVEGDSTVCDQSDPNYSGWAQHLPQHFASPISVANYADSGESSSSVLNSAKLWPTIKAGMKAGDWVMVQVGHNDKNITAAAFKANLTRMVDDVKAANAHMILVTPLSRVGYALAAEHVNSTGANLPQIIRDLGAAENVPVIDLTVISWNWVQTINWRDYFALGTDHTHTNHDGADVISGFVRDAIREQIPELAQYLR